MRIQREMAVSPDALWSSGVTVRKPATPRYVSRPARRSFGRLTCWSVVAYLGCVDPDLEGIETPESELVRRARALGQQSLARALGVSADRVLVHRVVAHEGSAAGVLRTYEDTAEMIIVGAHQRGMVRRLLHGPSISHGLIEHSRVPVVVVPHD